MKTKSVITTLLAWRIYLLFILYFSLSALPIRYSFLGGGLSTYLSNPSIWALANFDGEHYLSLVLYGYRPLEYFFFPLFPLIIRYITEIVGQSPIEVLIVGLTFNSITLFIALIGLRKLISIDYTTITARYVILSLLLFPTAFYFAGFYTESLFLALTVWSFYFARKGNWILAGILGAFATSTRIIGIALLPAFLVEAYSQYRLNKMRKSVFVRSIIASSISCLGIFSFMWFLHQKTGNALEFMTSLNSVFGEQRSETLVLFPQVFYRYIMKIIPAIDYTVFPLVFTTYLELLTGILFLFLVFVSFAKLRLSYSVYLMLGFLIPTLSGSFSSFPRYSLVLFPGFILIALLLQKLSKLLVYTIALVSILLLSIATALFSRGYWIS